jgi:hypothetical protein
MLNTPRTPVSDAQLLKAIEVVTQHVGKRIEKHGRGAFTSKHEALGVFAEEYAELLEAAQDDTSLTPFIEESVDLAVTGIFSLASAISSMDAATGTETKPTEVPEVGVQVEATENGFKIFNPYGA